MTDRGSRDQPGEIRLRTLADWAKSDERDIRSQRGESWSSRPSSRSRDASSRRNRWAMKLRGVDWVVTVRYQDAGVELMRPTVPLQR